MGKYDLELKNERKQLQAKNARYLSKRYQEGSYECENILDMRIIKGHRYYLIKWKGYSTKDNTWEPVNNLLTIAADVLKFQQDKKQYIKQIQSKWSYLFHNRKVNEPLETNEVRKLQRYSKKNEYDQDQSRKRTNRRSKKIKKIVENNLTESSKSLTDQKQKLDDQSISYKRRLRVRNNRNSKINNDQEVVNQNQSQQISSFSVSNISSQILNSQFIYENKCQSVEEFSHQNNSAIQSPINLAQKPDLLEELLEYTQNSKVYQKSQKQVSSQKHTRQASSKEILKNTLKKLTGSSPQISRKQDILQTLIKNQTFQQTQKSKENPFKISNYLIQTPKKSSVYSSNLPIQRSLNKYIYRSKLRKNSNASNEKEKMVEIIHHLELPAKEISQDIISEKAQEVDEQDHLKNNYNLKLFNIKKYNLYQILGKQKKQMQEEVNQEKLSRITKKDQNNISQNRQDQQYLELNSHQQKSKEKERKPFFQVKIQPSSNAYEKQQKNQPHAVQQQKVNEMSFKSQKNRLILSKTRGLLIKDASTKQKQQSCSQFQMLEKQINKDFDSIIFHNKSNPFISQNQYQNHDQQHRGEHNLQSEQSQSPQISSYNSIIQSKRHQHPRLIEQTINTSHISPKIKKIAKPFKNTSTNTFKKEKKNSDSESQNEPHNLYDMSYLLMNSISFQELRLRCIKVVKIIKMFKFQGCSILIVAVRDGNELQERFILYNLMRDFYPKLLLKYLEQNGKLEV